MSLFRNLWTDETGVILTAETVMLGTVGVLAMTAGVGAMSSAMNEELADVSRAFRSFDQSFQVTGYRVDTTTESSSSDSNRGESPALAMKTGSAFQQTSAQSTVDAFSVRPVAAQVVAPSVFSSETEVEPRSAAKETAGKTEAEMREELTQLLEEYSRLQTLRKQQIEQQAASGGHPAKTF
ncbi:MAG: hypothetical protein O2820_17480 [Planctomycetota bacterium]|nr:hypothetical protein [Planctomycetota bacterium]MDA1251011.1 hypothetical protein [Planctomycetota bacterium]